MRKDTIRAIIAEVVVLAVYHLLAFVIPFAHTAVFWISYGFTLVAFAVFCASIYVAFLKNPDAKSRFYGFSIARVGALYFCVQTVISLLAMAFAKVIPWWIPVVVYSVGLGAVILDLLSAKSVVETAQTLDVKLKTVTATMRGLQSKVSHMAAQSDNAALKKLAEEFRYSDPVSSEAIADAEADLTAAVDELQAAYVDGDSETVEKLCRKVDALLAERNRLCKLNKN